MTLTDSPSLRLSPEAARPPAIVVPLVLRRALHFALASALAIPLAGCQALLTDERPACADDDPLACPYSHRIALTIDNQQRGELTDFPLLVTLDSNAIEYAEFSDDGRDMLFVDSESLTPLPYEIESWNPGGISRVWVKVPRIAGDSADTRIDLLHDSERHNGANVPGEVWSNGYVSVQHFTEADLNDGTVDDSTGNGHAGTVIGGILGVPGQVGRGIQFTGQPGSHVNFGAINEMLPPPGETRTMTFWLLQSSVITGFPGYILLEKEDACSGLRVYVLDDGYTVPVLLSPGSDGFDPCTKPNSVAAGVALANDRWYYLMITLAHNLDDTAVVRADARAIGVAPQSDESAPGSVPAGIENAAQARLGTDNENSDPMQPRLPFHGAFDELRVSSRARSQDWYDAQFEAMTNGLVTFETLY